MAVSTPMAILTLASLVPIGSACDRGLTSDNRYPVTNQVIRAPEPLPRDVLARSPAVHSDSSRASHSRLGVRAVTTRCFDVLTITVASVRTGPTFWRQITH
jgi:hypothetical protein